MSEKQTGNLFAPCVDRLLTIGEAAELTKLAVGTLYHLVSQRRIPVVRLSSRCIRFRLSSLQQWWEKMSDTGVG
jgi:excisionase family DNA binding protein